MTRLRRITAIALAGVSLPALAAAAPEGWAPLLEPDTLAAMLDSDAEIRVVRVSGDYEAGHIPGAVSAPYAQWRGPPQNPGALREPEEFRDLVQSLGIEADTPVVVVHEGASTSDMGTAARVYWTLKSLGVQDLALLNGGFAAWAEAGHEVATGSSQVAHSDFDARWSEDWRVDTAEVEALVESGDARLIDARPTGFFEGITWSIARPGTIPGSGNLTFEDWFEGGRMVDAASARDIAEAYDQTDAPLTVSFCNTGHWAAINWFALSELAGVENTRLYAESMAEWTAAGRPLDNAPGRLTVYWTQTRDWFDGLL